MRVWWQSKKYTYSAEAVAILLLSLLLFYLFGPSPHFNCFFQMVAIWAHFWTSKVVRQFACVSSKAPCISFSLAFWSPGSQSSKNGMSVFQFIGKRNVRFFPGSRLLVSRGWSTCKNTWCFDTSKKRNVRCFMLSSMIFQWLQIIDISSSMIWTNGMPHSNILVNEMCYAQMWK